MLLATSETKHIEARDMRKFILALCITAVSFPALAIQRYNVQSMSCARVQAAVNSEGAAILRYRSARNPSLPLYDRYVRNGSYCDPSRYAKRSYVPTRDNNRCPVLKCSDKLYDDFND